MALTVSESTTLAEERKRLGQYFTGVRLARSLAALAHASEANSILDPMAGTGDMLVACQELGASAARIGAIELVPDTAAECWDRSRDLAPWVGVRTGSAFDPQSWHELDVEWDLVITNPPYVRYQTGTHGSSGATKAPTAREVRTGLIQVLEQLPSLSAVEREVFLKAATTYSGLADLAVPSWLLASALVTRNGRLAIVAPDTWLSRNYAVSVVAVLRRLFEIEVVANDVEASWFESALVRTSLIVARRVEDKGSGFEPNRHLVVQVPRTAGSAKSIVGHAFPVDEPEKAFAQWIGSGEHPATGPLVSEWSDELDLIDALTRSSDRQVLQGSGGGGNLRPHLGDARIPRRVRQILGSTNVQSLCDLSSLGWTIGQGLRTGANDFYYVDVLSEGGYCSPLMPGQALEIPRDVVCPAIRGQKDLVRDSCGSWLERGGVLYLEGWARPEDSDLEGWRQIDGDLSSLIQVASHTTYKRGSRITRLPELSAVRTNVRNGRLWYHLPPFGRRHLPELFLARVNAKTPRPHLNQNGPRFEPRVVDANFATLWRDPSSRRSLHPIALMALLAGTWTAAMLETLCTVMGGGALKVEATHLRRLVIPRIDSCSEQELMSIGEVLIWNGSSDRAVDEVDQIVGSSLGIPDSKVLMLRDLVAELVNSRTPQACSD